MHRLLPVTVAVAALVGLLVAGGRAITPAAAPSTLHLPGLVRGGVAAPPWYLTRGGPTSDKAWGVDTDADGNVYLATYETAPGTLSDIYLYKFAPDGRQLWRSAPWGRTGNDQAYIVVVEGATAYVAGRSDTSLDINSADMAVIAYNTAGGSVAWHWIGPPGAGYDETDGLAVTPDGIFIAGWRAVAGRSNDLAVGKLSLDGHLQWMTTWGSPKWDEANGQIVVTPDTIYVGGRFAAENIIFGGHAILAAFSRNDGSYLWHRQWGVFGSDALGIAGGPDGLFVTGIDYVGFNAQVFLRKYTAAGDLVWVADWGGPGGEASRVLEVAPDGSLYVAANTHSFGAVGSDIALVHFSPEGSLLWQRTWGVAGDELAHGLALDGDTVYIAGETSSFGAGGADGVLIQGRLSTATLGTTGP